MNDANTTIAQLTDEIKLLRKQVSEHKQTAFRLDLINERLMNVIDEVENRLDEADEYGEQIETDDVRGWINGARNV